MKKLILALLAAALLIPSLALAADKSEAPSIVSLKDGQVMLDIQARPLSVVIGDGKVAPIEASEITTICFFVEPGLEKNIIEKPVRLVGHYIVAEAPKDADYTHWNYRTKDGRWLLVDPPAAELCDKTTAVEHVFVNGTDMGCSFTARGTEKDAAAFRTVNYTPGGKKPDA